MDTPFTRRNSVDETYNYEDEFINISNTYMRLLYSITDNYSTNLQTYQTLMERCLTMGFQTQMNLLKEKSFHYHHLYIICHLIIYYI